MQSSEERLSSARNSCGVRMFALIAHQTSKSIKRALSLAARPIEAPAWLILERTCALSRSSFPRPQTEAPRHRRPHWLAG
jgi:hypothetical protein